MNHRKIPNLPIRLRVHPIAGQDRRSYRVGRQNFSRAYQGEPLTLTITTDVPIPESIQVNLVTTMISEEAGLLTHIPFAHTDERTLTCCVIPERPGFHSFRAEFSLDEGVTWRRDTVPDAWVLVDPPQVDGLCLYTLIPTVSGTLADWKTDLHRIREMGFNAVHLLPVTKLDTSESPYAAKDLFEIDHSYLVGGPSSDGLAELEEFVEEAKALNLRLCFDLVLNHVGVDSKMARRAPDWIVPDNRQPDGFQRAGYWSSQGWQTWNDLVLINYEHPSDMIRAEIWGYMSDYALFWAKYANDTGGFVRFDNLHSSNPDFVQAVTKALHSEFPAVGLLAEYFTDEHTLLHNELHWGLNLILATPWNLRFAPDLRNYLDYMHRLSAHVRYFMPLTSHDSGSPAQEFGTAESTVPRYVAAALLGTGATGIPQGVEFGEEERIAFIGRKPKMPFPSEQRFGLFIGRINAILKSHSAFRRGGNCRFVDNGHHAVIAAYREDTETQSIGYLVACNFDIHGFQTIVVDLSADIGSDPPVSCRELISEEMRVFSGPRVEITLPPCGAQVLHFLREAVNIEHAGTVA